MKEKIQVEHKKIDVSKFHLYIENANSGFISIHCIPIFVDFVGAG